VIAFSVTKFIQDINPFYHPPPKELSTSEKIQEAVTSTFNNISSFVKNLLTINSTPSFFSKRNIINLTSLFFTVVITYGIISTLGISEIIFQVLLGLFLAKLVNKVITKLQEKGAIPTLDQLFHKDMKTISKIIVGIISAFILLRLNPLLENKISDFLKNIFNVTITEEQNVAHLIKDNSLSGVVMSIYAAIGAPIIEEILFRGYLQNYFEVTSKESTQNSSDSNNVMSRLEKIKTILKTSLVFGAIHLSPSMGWTNIPIIIVITLMGAVMSILKETTKDLWAPTTLHMVNNTLSVLKLRQVN